MLLNMAHLSFIDSLWIGEAYDYVNSDMDYYLVEIAGLPFGLMSDMLVSMGINFEVWHLPCSLPPAFSFPSFSSCFVNIIPG